MGFHIAHHPERSMVLFTLTAEFDTSVVTPAILNEARAALSGLDEPVFFVADMRGPRITVTEALRSIEPLAFGDHSFVRDPNVREVLLVIQNPLVRKVAEGVASALQDEVTILVFEDLNTATAYVEQSLKANNSPPSDAH